MISPRLDRILSLLLASDAPIPMGELAELLCVSRRTVARELAAAPAALAPYKVQVSSQNGEGIRLDGAPGELEKLRRHTAKRNWLLPSSKQERHWRLALEALSRPGPRKALSYARLLGVSEATISSDLEAIVKWLPRFGLVLNRKQGISITGDEADIRSAICYVLGRLRNKPQPYSAPLAWDLLGKAVDHGPARAELARFTPESEFALRCYLAVAVARISGGLELTGAKAADDEHLMDANLLADALEAAGGPVWSAVERQGLAVRLMAGRVAFGVDGIAPGPPASSEVQTLVYRMIEAYDPPNASALKLDEQLTAGLCAHVRALTIRLENNFEIEDPLLEHIARDFPEVLQGSRQALKVLQRRDLEIPDAEAGFLAAHFGAAMLRLAERNEPYRKISLGVVCAHGIGTAYLMVSELQRRFGRLARIEVCPIDDQDDWERFDLMISTLPELGAAGPPVVFVHPILSEDELRQIAEAIDGASRQGGRRDPARRSEGMVKATRAIAALAGAISEVIESFAVICVPSAMSQGELFKMIGYRFGDGPTGGAVVHSALQQREAMATQVIPELSLALLHARTAGVGRPHLAVLTPEPGPFADPALTAVKACVIMLVPQAAGTELVELFGRVSSELIDNPEFLAQVHAGQRRELLDNLEKMAEDQLLKTIQRLLP
ncbi:MAG: PRD domain-containing protein [Propionibacteriaceae bacterium]|jgi:mannitol operon transcriptional antiterminator|nr:PRD domain-containing protein [Propionibacteriaceae bacterium]